MSSIITNQVDSMDSLATKKRRFVNYVLDIAFFLLLGLVYRYIKYIWTFGELVGFQEEMFRVKLLVSIPIAIVYYSAFEIITGRTPAKLITKM